jgi:peptide-methionine (S)-S-oxide reductase
VNRMSLNRIGLSLLLAAVLVAPAAAQTAVKPSAGRQETVVFAGGCFWGVEAVYRHTKGVLSATSGYSGGTVVSPGYELVSTGTTGHAESVRVVFDPSVVSFRQLLDVFFMVAHDPTEKNRQGPDTGTQYRSVVFFSSPEQQQATQAYVAELTSAKVYPRPIVTEIVPLQAFYPAEDYHQNYLALHKTQPYIVYNDLPKLGQLEAKYPGLWRDS